MKCLNFLLKTNLSCQISLVLKPGDACVNQTSHEIYKSFDEGHEVTGVFLDISKAFDKVWQDGIIFKLTQNGILGIY